MSLNGARNGNPPERLEPSVNMKNRKPKLVVVVGIDFDRSYAGTQYLLEHLADTFEIVLYAYTDASSGRWYRQLPFSLHIFPFRDSVWDGGRLRIVSKAFRALVFLRMLFAGQVLVTETAYLREAAWAKKIRGKRMVLTQFCQELYFTEEYPLGRWPATQKRHARVPDVVIDVDPFRAKIRAEYYGLQKTPHVLRNTFPLAQLPPPAPRGELWNLAHISPPPAGMPVLVHAGGVVREKPFERIIDAVAELQQPLFLLAFCTATDERIQHFRDLAAKKLKPGSFHLGPTVPRERLRASLWEADIGAVDYTFSVEPTVNQRHCAPTKLYEYMACGLAILGSNNDSLRAVVEREEIGHCAKGDDPRDLSQALADMIESGLAKMKERAAEVFAERYSYETACAAEVRKIAGDMLARGRPAGRGWLWRGGS